MICADANLAVALILDYEHSSRVEALFAEQRRTDERIVAVDLLGYEVTNAVRRAVRAGLPFAEARERLARLPRLHIELHPAADLHDRALAIAHESGQGASYDAHYVALAEVLRCDLWTTDEKLVREMRPRYPFVRSLADLRIA